ncbi:MAG: GvpL/GvpF family gas vesicle protein, partial [Dehalococcoidia bacterium]
VARRVAQTREAIARKGQPAEEERAQLGKMVKARIDRRREAYRKRVEDFLRPLAVDAAASAQASDEMVVNMAFLVYRDRQSQFDEGVKQLDMLLHNEISFRLIGPLPPYSFSTVEVTRLTSKQIEEARQTLHLGDVITETEVREAYRHLAAEEHRGLEARNGLANYGFTSLKRAYEYLLSFCQAGAVVFGGREADLTYTQSVGNLYAMSINRTGTVEADAASLAEAEMALRH